MENKKINDMLRFYYLASSLTDKIRTGWIYWNIDKDRIESIAEHIYSTCILAISINSEFPNNNVNIQRVIMMLTLHELEEVVIGDITPVDNITREQKREMGKVGVSYVLGDLLKRDEYYDLIEEFNDRETPDAHFAYLCDKLQCDLKAKQYFDEGYARFNDGINEKVITNKDVQERINAGANNVYEVFYKADENIYQNDTIFKEILNISKNINSIDYRLPDGSSV